MRKNNILNCLLGAALLAGINLNAGNEDRVGQAGASELLINPFARSAGFGSANTAFVRGLEAQFLNVAGTAFTKKSEFVFAHTIWLSGADININSFGFTQAVGADKTGVLGFSVMSMSFGDIPITTVNQPDGGLGNFRPSFTNIGISYAKEFSNSIYGGLAMRTVSQRISDLGALGVCFDAGVQYVTGKDDNLRFGISLRNVGPRMNFSGDGLSFRGTVPETGTNLTVSQRTESFEMPALLNIGVGYIIKLAERQDLSLAANFTSNSFSKDQFMFGAEYSFNKRFMLRGGYMVDTKSKVDGNFANLGRTSALTGPTGGFSVETPINKKSGSTISFDYAYRATNPFAGVHTIGARINL